MGDTDLQVILNGRSGTTTVAPELVDIWNADKSALVEEVMRLRLEVQRLKALNHVD